MNTCQCGCGGLTALAKRTNACFGHKKGMPLRFIRGHENIGRTPWNRGQTTYGGADRKCCDCGQIKPLNEFKIDRKMYLGRSGQCKECHNEKAKSYWKSERGKAAKRQFTERRKAHWEQVSIAERDKSLKRRFGIGLPEYNLLKTEQRELCAICEQHAGIKTLHVDHDHISGQVRGLLCRNCNVAIGLFHEDVECLRRAIEYLEKPRKKLVA